MTAGELAVGVVFLAIGIVGMLISDFFRVLEKPSNVVPFRRTEQDQQTERDLIRQYWSKGDTHDAA